MAADSSTAGLTSKLARFSSQHDDIILLTTTFESKSFDTLRPIFVNPHANPLAIVRPSTIEAVSATVSFLASNKIPFTVRVGGHDLHGRSVEDGGVVLDLRLLNQVVIDKSGSEADGGKTATARIGGGVLIGDLLSALEPHGLVTPVGTVSGVGYLGWAMHGGYGPYSSGFGLGIDQIVAAKVVDATGRVVDADGELLKAIKGAGGAFGVVVEAVVRVCELDSVCPVFENHLRTTSLPPEVATKWRMVLSILFRFSPAHSSSTRTTLQLRSALSTKPTKP